MIAVIADDFTGAAEIGGMGLRRGLKVIIETTVTGSEDADLLVIATNTRSMAVDSAKEEIEKVTRQLLELSPKYIFKKLDSVLRGHIYEELISQQFISGKKRVILIPANPNSNRIIRNGIYYIDGVSLSETSFANDPEFPITCSDVKEIIGSEQDKVYSADICDHLADSGIIIGNVINEKDLISWAEIIDEDTLPAGGSGFFEALLQLDFPEVHANGNHEFFLGKNVLFIFGSTYPKETVILHKFREAGVEIMNLPDLLFSGNFPEPALQRWSEKIAAKVRSKGRVALTTVFEVQNESILPTTIRDVVGQLVKKVMDLVQMNDLFVEGGATAFQILSNLGVSRLEPFRELDFGIIQMHATHVMNLCITTKPGSYLWPDFILNKNALN